MKSKLKFSDFFIQNYCAPKQVPFFFLKNKEIGVINSAVEFYTVLIKGIRESKHRINLSSLYIGTGPMEKFMLNEIVKASNKNQHLTVNLIVDANRGSRRSPEGESCFTMFRKMMEEAVYPQNMNLHFFQHNSLARNSFLAPTYMTRETQGVFHLKHYIFDQTVILTGANLSEEYFTTRYDRYFYVNQDKAFSDFLMDFNQVFIDCGDKVKTGMLPEEEWKKIAQHKENFGRKLSVFLYTSFINGRFEKKLQQINDICWKTEKQKNKKPPISKELVIQHNFEEKTKLDFKSIQNQEEMFFKIQSPFQFYLEKYSNYSGQLETGVSLAIPSFQSSLVDYRMEEWLIAEFLKFVFSFNKETQFEFTFTTGYFNPSDVLMNLFLEIPENVNLKIMTAAPSANSFFKAKGIKGGVPSMYRCSLIKWMKAFEKMKNVSFYEFEKPNATYHGKGLWLKCLNNPEVEYVTVYGSSNFSNRSYHKDLEGQVYLITQEQDLIQAFEEEKKELMKYAKVVHLENILNDSQTKVGLIQRFWFKVLKNYL